MRVFPYARVLIGIWSLSLTAQQPDVFPENRADSFSLDKEVALGKEMASELQRRTSAIQDTEIERYVTSLGRRLESAMPESRIPFTFTVITDDPCRSTHESVSVPGGYIFIPAALILATHTEAEFAGMLSHSIAHVAMHHITRQVPPTIPMVIGGCSEYVLVPMAFLAEQRTYELEADRLAVSAMARAGFDPVEFVAYIRREQTEPPRPERFSLLPTRDERIAAMSSIIERFPRSSHDGAQSEFLKIQERIRPLTQSQRRRSPSPPTLRRSQSRGN